jgi:hypothetical protein
MYYHAFVPINIVLYCIVLYLKSFRLTQGVTFQIYNLRLQLIFMRNLFLLIWKSTKCFDNFTISREYSNIPSGLMFHFKFYSTKPYRNLFSRNTTVGYDLDSTDSVCRTTLTEADPAYSDDCSGCRDR